MTNKISKKDLNEKVEVNLVYESGVKALKSITNIEERYVFFKVIYNNGEITFSSLDDAINFYNEI